MSNSTTASGSFVQVPPQSSGKKIATEFRTELFVDNIVVDQIPSDTEIVGLNSGASGIITGAELNINGSEYGAIYLKNANGTFLDTEELQIDHSTVARVNTKINPRTDYDVQKVVLSDPDNLFYTQKVDRFGASFSTFSDGSPSFGPFGTLMTGEPIVIRDYEFPYGIESSDFWNNTKGNATIEWEEKAAAALLTTSTESGDLAQMTSNYYHDYTPGTGTLIELTCQIGDKGKENVVRRWGYYDHSNGFFFELNQGELYVVIRSNTTGETVETRIHQSQWNQDRLDGSNSINFNLDVTKGNIFWIDFQWLGAGRVRFGVIEPSGARLTCHIVENANTNSVYPYTRTATLPIRWEQFNTDFVTSTSQMRVACAVVKSTSRITKIGDLRTASTDIERISIGDGKFIIGAIRPALKYKGQVNRSKLRVKSITFTNLGDGVVRFTSHTTFNQVLAGLGAEFVPVSDESSFEICRQRMPHVPDHSRERITFLVGPGQTYHNQDISNELDPKVELSLYADGQTQPVFFVTAEMLNGESADVMIAINWEESKR